MASNPELSFLETLLDTTGIADMLADPALTHTLLAPSGRSVGSRSRTAMPCHLFI